MAQNQQKHLTFILVPEARMKMRKKGNQGDMRMGKSKENTYIYMYMYIYIYIHLLIKSDNAYWHYVSKYLNSLL